MMKITHFDAWLEGAEQGESTVYHRGSLAYDRDEQMLDPAQEYRGDPPRPNTIPTPAAKAVYALADAVWRAMERGAVHLVQRRHGENDYEYLAIKR